MRDERGAATVWTAAALVLLAAATLLAAGQVGAVALRHRAQTAADLAALAAAGGIGLAPSDGPTGAACVAAGRTAAANGARLTACVPRLAADGRTGDVAVTVAVDGAVAGIPLHAEARARGARRPAITAVRGPAGVPGTAGASVRRGVRGPSRCTWRGPVAAFVLRRACGCGGGRSPTTTTRPLGRHLWGDDRWT